MRCAALVSAGVNPLAKLENFSFKYDQLISYRSIQILFGHSVCEIDIMGDGSLAIGKGKNSLKCIECV